MEPSGYKTPQVVFCVVLDEMLHVFSVNSLHMCKLPAFTPDVVMKQSLYILSKLASHFTAPGHMLVSIQTVRLSQAVCKLNTHSKPTAM